MDGKGKSESNLHSELSAKARAVENFDLDNKAVRKDIEPNEFEKIREKTRTINGFRLEKQMEVLDKLEDIKNSLIPLGFELEGLKRDEVEKLTQRGGELSGGDSSFFDFIHYELENSYRLNDVDNLLLDQLFNIQMSLRALVGKEV